MYKQLKRYQVAMKKGICEGSVAEEIPVMFNTLVSSMTETLDRLTANSEVPHQAVDGDKEGTGSVSMEAQEEEVESHCQPDALHSAEEAVPSTPSNPVPESTALACLPAVRSPATVTPSTNPYCAMRAGLETVRQRKDTDMLCCAVLCCDAISYDMMFRDVIRCDVPLKALDFTHPFSSPVSLIVLLTV